MLEKSCGWWLIWYLLFFCHGGAEATESRPYIDPDITQSSKVMSPQGQPLVINCGINGFPKPLITWYKSLEVMAPDNRVSVLSNGSLHFMRLTTGDQDYYYCDGKNYLGQVKSAKIFVDVAYINPLFEQEPNSQYIRGKSRTLPCSPPASHPPANVTWYKDKQPMKYRTGELAAYILDPAKSIWDLFFTDIQKQDEGSYFCIASNNFAVPMSRTSKSAVVQIEGQLQWDVKEKVTDYGQNVTLFCPVENCCNELAGWVVGQESIFFDLKKYSNDSSKKYGGTYNKDGFGVVIRNLSEADLNVTHRCDYGFNRSTPKYLLHDDVFIESTDVPDKDKDKDNNTVAENDTVTESNTVAENNTVAIVIPIVVAIVVIVVVVVAIILYRRKNKKKKPEGTEDEMTTFITSDDQQDLEEINETDDLDLHEAIVKKYRTKPKIPNDFLNDKDFLSKLLKECGKNTEGLLPYSSGGIDVVYFHATLLVVVMKYRPQTEIVKEVLNDMSTTLTSQSPSPVVIVYHRSVKTAMEKVCKEDCKKQIDKEDCEKQIDKEDGEKQIDKEDGEKPIYKGGEKPIYKEDCEKQIEIFRKFIEKHKFDYSASSCLQQCIYKSGQ